MPSLPALLPRRSNGEQWRALYKRAAKLGSVFREEVFRFSYHTLVITGFAAVVYGHAKVK